MLPSSHRPLGRTLWPVSPVGFGGYRIHERDPEHAEALRLALRSGCNLIDTSANYGDGSSERLIGRVLGELIAQGELKREEVFVVSKAGYVQGSNLERARAKPDPEMVRYSDDCWHCISPAFLEEQLTLSLERLGLGQLDALLLHNPEYYLKAGGNHAEYYRRIGAAFGQLEREVERGRLRWFGVSSNTLPDPREAPDFTSLETLLELAARHGPHFALIQFPFNVFEPGAALETNNGARTVLELAREKNLGTLVNRPLNAFRDHRLVRLADFPSHDDRDVVGDFKSAMNAATALEASYPGRKLVPARQIAWGHFLRENFKRLSEVDSWRAFVDHRLRPVLAEALDALQSEFGEWVSQYRPAASRLVETYSAYLESQACAESDKIAGLIDHLFSDLRDSPTLSQKAIRLYLSLAGVDCVLAGMRQTRYVRDLVGIGRPATISDTEAARRTLEFRDLVQRT